MIDVGPAQQGGVKVEIKGSERKRGLPLFLLEASHASNSWYVRLSLSLINKYIVFSLYSLDYRYRGAQPITGGAIPGLAVLGFVREQAEQARSRPVSGTPPSIASASAPASRFLPPLLLMMDCYMGL